MFTRSVGTLRRLDRNQPECQPRITGVTQLACRGEAAILDGANDRLFGVERGADLASVANAQPRARQAAWYEAAIKEAGEAKRAARSVSGHHGEMVG